MRIEKLDLKDADKEITYRNGQEIDGLVQWENNRKSIMEILLNQTSL